MKSLCGTWIYINKYIYIYIYKIYSILKSELKYVV